MTDSKIYVLCIDSNSQFFEIDQIENRSLFFSLSKPDFATLSKKKLEATEICVVFTYIIAHKTC